MGDVVTNAAAAAGWGYCAVQIAKTPAAFVKMITAYVHIAMYSAGGISIILSGGGPGGLNLLTSLVMMFFYTRLAKAKKVT